MSVNKNAKQAVPSQSPYLQTPKELSGNLMVGVISNQNLKNSSYVGANLTFLFSFLSSKKRIMSEGCRFSTFIIIKPAFGDYKASSYNKNSVKCFLCWW